MMNSFDKIAIVGMDALFPGGERGLEEHWLNVLAGKDCARQVPAQRWHGLSAARLQSVDVQPDRVASTRACLLADGMEFDLADLQLPAELLRDLDPMYLALLHVGRRLWRACGNTDPQRVGIIIGNIVLPTEQAARLSAQLLHSDFVANAPHALNGQVAGLPAALLARALKFSGTAWTLDAACASSLYALKYACDELLAGRADCMLSGGLSRPDCLYTQMGFTQLRALSPSGCCRPFDHKADGLVVGEGCGLLALKRLGDAVAEGDRIYATIEGIGIANDLGGSLMQPDSEGQLRAMRMAYEQAAWEPESVQHIECHGTGTPTGDSVELRSLRSLWEGRAGRCVIGSVKSNIGHLLTAAGSASMIKTLLAMRDGQFPPTANFDHAPEDFALEDSPFHVLASAEPWLAPEGEPRRAAVSGFGFGGINAHVLVQEYLAAQPPAAEARVEVIREIPRCDAVAIVGLAARLGGMSEMQAITDRLLADDDESPQSPEPLGTLRLPFGKYPIPPNELRQLLPQQLVMLETADEALRTAGWLEMSHEQRCRMGVFIGIGLDFNSCNFHLRWVRDSGAELGHGGSPLNADRTMGALGGIVASRVARVFQVGGPAFTFSSEETSGLHALEAAVRALRNGELDRVLIGAVDLPCDKRMRRLLGEEFQNMRSVLQSNDSVSSASAMPVDTAIAMTLMRADDARARGDRVYAVIGDVSSSGAHAEVEDGVEPILPSPGYAGAAQGMLVLLRAVLALQHRVLPMRTKMRYWLHDRHLGQRRAMIAQDNLAGGRVTAILEEGDFNDSVRIGVGHQERLFLLAAQDAHGLLSELENLRFDRLPDAVLGAKRIALRAGDPESLRAVAQRVAAAVRAEQSLDDAQACYFPDPAECAGDLAFVFPGSGNHYLGMGRELSAIFPDVLETRHRENEFLKSQFCDAAFWEERDAGHELTPRDFIFTQVSVGIFIHDVVTQFGIAADAMIGYSLGETTALFAARAWRDSDEMLRRVNAGTLFTEDLAGSCRAAQRHWGVDAPVHWQAGVVRAPVERLRAAIAEFPRVYLLIINTPKECVIGGERASVMALTKQLGIHLHAIPGVISVHCAVAEEVGESYRDLHLFETTSPPNLRFYSGTRGSSYVVNRDSAADSILGQAVQPFDYTQVIESAWRDGIRHFIELGPGRSCTKMIDAILHDRPHYSQAICVRGKNEVQGLLAALSGLHCRGYSVDAERLVGMYPPPAAMEIKPVLEIDVDSDLVGLRAAVPLPNALPNAAASAASPALPDAVADSRVDRGIADSSSSFVHEHFERLNAGFDTALQRLRAIYPGIAATTSPDSTAEPPPRMPAGIAATTSPDSTAEPPRMPAGIAAIISPNNAAEPPRMPAGIAAITSPNSAAEPPRMPAGIAAITSPDSAAEPPRMLDRRQCMAFATGSIRQVLGMQYAAADAFPSRVRLPDEPLMLVDRILAVEGAPNALLGAQEEGRDIAGIGGRVVTEHDVHRDAWYLDSGRMPVCIAVEAGQADLFLSAWLGIDGITRGQAVYRLLDAGIRFHGPLPVAGEHVRYDIHIDGFFRQGDTWLFRFRFEGTTLGRPLLSMIGGCAGFFTAAELQAGQGITLSSLEQQRYVNVGAKTRAWQALAPMRASEEFSDAQLTALRIGDLEGAFGAEFAGLPLKRPMGLPSGRMALVHRILECSMGDDTHLPRIKGEVDIHADDWFLKCHFVDDQVMPGTLMYESCLHTLRVLLLRMGWVGEANEFVYEPVPGIHSQLKCRGQVIATTHRVQYEIFLMEFGYGDDGTPYAIADALMYADDRPIVQMKNMSVRLTGLQHERLRALWAKRPVGTPGKRLELFDNASILAFAEGKPSDAFGEKYRIFDDDRRIARLPRPPYKFLDRIVDIQSCRQWELSAGGEIEAEYDIPVNVWYCSAARMEEMPFAVLLEVALQPCGWLAAYLGSALTSEVDLSFRNLGGSAIKYRAIGLAPEVLRTHVKISKVSHSGGMIIQHYDYRLYLGSEKVYEGDTYFGFFSKEALADQAGITGAKPWCIPAERTPCPCPYPREEPFPDDVWRMVDDIVDCDMEGGSHGLGHILGRIKVSPDAWFFKAHFHQDPVWPGSLGLEACLQLMQFYAWRRFGGKAHSRFEFMGDQKRHAWLYRGQILPTDDTVELSVVISAVDESRQQICADGFLSVDGRIIYQMTDFRLRMT